MKTPTVYSGISAVTLPPKATSSTAATSGEHDDAAVERQPLAAELEARAAGSRRAPGCSTAAGSRRTPCSRPGRAAPRSRTGRGSGNGDAGADEGRGQLAEHRLLLGRIGQDAELAGQEADAEEDDAEEGSPSATSTICALRASGGLNAGTPFDTASVPVSATDPDAKARRMSSKPSGSTRRAPSHSGGGRVVGHGARWRSGTARSPIRPKIATR